MKLVPVDSNSSRKKLHALSLVGLNDVASERFLCKLRRGTANDSRESRREGA